MDLTLAQLRLLVPRGAAAPRVLEQEAPDDVVHSSTSHLHPRSSYVGRTILLLLLLRSPTRSNSLHRDKAASRRICDHNYSGEIQSLFFGLFQILIWLLNYLYYTLWMV